MLDTQTVKNVIEAALMVAAKPLSIDTLERLFQTEIDPPPRKQIRQVLELLQMDYSPRGIELKEVATGFRIQAREDYGRWLGALYQERAPRYSRALLETLVLIAYRQPITRKEIESIRGVAVSSNIIQQLKERNWIRILGYEKTPGRPALFGTTKEFLSYFNMKALGDLPRLMEVENIEGLETISNIPLEDEVDAPSDIPDNVISLEDLKAMANDEPAPFDNDNGNESK